VTRIPAAHVAHVVAAHAEPKTDRTCLLMWRMLSLVVAAILAGALHRYEMSGVVALLGEHAGECITYVGEWAGRWS